MWFVQHTPTAGSDAVANSRLWHIPLIVAVSGSFEALFVHHGIGWLFDEGWPLYAAMRLHRGGVLYDDVFFLFPPGHALLAWIAYGLDPPGVVLARIFYAAFNIVLCVVLYLLGRRIMPASFALLGALMLAVAAPRSHLVQLLFGYRYLVFSVLTLLAFNARLLRGDARWLLLAGGSAGIALLFRLTPAFAVSCGVSIAVIANDRRWRVWVRDWGWYGLGLCLVLAPALAWFAAGVGLDALWQAAVVKIMPLQSMQSKPIPEMVFPRRWDRDLIAFWFVPVQYWSYGLLYLGYIAVLGTKWWTSYRKRTPFAHTLLLAIVIWGAVFFLRTLGRSDEHHLTSALPPVCLLLAHLLHSLLRWRSRDESASRAVSPRRWAVTDAIACFALLATWVFLQASDTYLSPAKRGLHPIASLGGAVSIENPKAAFMLDYRVETIRKSTRPGDTILDLTNAPLLYVMTDRMGPGYIDVITPGVFMNRDEEEKLITRLESSPPALVIWPGYAFDGMPSRSIVRIAPLLSRWVADHYEQPDPEGKPLLLFPRAGAFASEGAAGEARGRSAEVPSP